MRFAPENRIIGLLLAAITVLVVCDEWNIAGWIAPAKPVLTVALIAVFAVTLPPGRKAFVFFAAGLTIVLALLRDDWFATVLKALGTTAFIAAFFTALTSLKSVAETLPSVSVRYACEFLSFEQDLVHSPLLT